MSATPIARALLIASLGAPLGAVACQSSDPAPAGTAKPPSATTAAATAARIDNPGATVADYLSCLEDERVMVVSAHRGGPVPGFPENALETFAHSIAAGPMLIETDVRLTADGEYILMHDDTLERTTTVTGEVAATDTDTIRDGFLVDNDDIATSFRAPTLEEALAWADGRTILQLDIKRGTPIDAVARLVEAAGAAPFAAIITYSEEDALIAARAAPTVTVSLGVSDIETLDTLTAQGLAANRIMAWTGTRTQRPMLWRALGDRGVTAAWGALWSLDEIVAETGNDALFAGLADLGLDVLSSDLPFRAYDALLARQDTEGAVRRCNTNAGDVS